MPPPRTTRAIQNETTGASGRETQQRAWSCHRSHWLPSSGHGCWRPPPVSATPATRPAGYPPEIAATGSSAHTWHSSPRVSLSAHAPLLHPSSFHPDAYARRRPEDAVLYQVVAEHWPAFRERAEEAGGLPKFVIDEFDAYLDCGRLGAG